MKKQEFEKLFSKHGAMVYRAAYSVTGNKHDAQDVQQDVFLTLIDRGRTLEFTTNPAGYLFRMAINKALEKFRKRTRQNETDDGLESLQGAASDGNLRETDMRQRLLGAIAKLEPEHAEVLLLSIEQGYTDAEIADMLGKTRVAVAVTLHRVRERLKELI
jgi:RNA polymerase sigma-70 factor (ECF subfamily)